MKHDYLDKYSRLDSPMHSLDPRVKILALFFLIIVAVTTPPQYLWSFSVYLGLVIIMAVASRVPSRHIITRALVIVPFVLLVAIFIPFISSKSGGRYDLWLFTVSHHGVMVLWNVLIKGTISVICLILLTSTTSFSRLLEGFERLHIPRFFTNTASFMYRYIFVITDEAQRMKRARDARNFGARWVWQSKVIGHLVGSLFIRSYERAERVYAAMASRGFDGTIPRSEGMGLRLSDWIFLILVAAIALTARLIWIWV